MNHKYDAKVSQAIEEASASADFEDMKLTGDDKKKIREDLDEQKSLLLSFYRRYLERQQKNIQDRKDSQKSDRTRKN